MQAGEVQRAAPVFFVRAGRAAGRRTTGAPGTTVAISHVAISHAHPRYRSHTPPGLCPGRPAMPNVRAAVVFWRAPVYQRGPSPRQGFSIGSADATRP